MIASLLPETANNSYRGHRLALWLFGLVVVMKTGIGLNSIFNGRYVAVSADGIPLETFGVSGAQAVVALFGMWGLAQAFICVLCVVALIRYRTLIPFMYLLLLLEHLSRRLFLTVMPIPRVGAPPGVLVNALLLSVMVVGLVLSLRGRAGNTSGAAQSGRGSKNAEA